MPPRTTFSGHAAWPRLRWTAYLLCGDEHLAEDLAQTTLVKTYAGWRRVRRDEAYSFARRTLVNTNIDRLRRGRLTEVPADDHDEVGRSAVTDEVDDTDLIIRVLAGRGAVQRRRAQPRQHLFWATVSSAIARVRAYDAAGTMIEDHRLRSCKDPVDCEVR